MHDLLNPDHELDYRCFSAFPLDELRDTTLVVLRTDYHGHLYAETVVGMGTGVHQVVWLLIHRGHMTLLVPPRGQRDAAPMSRLVATLGRPTPTTPALGWASLLHAAEAWTCDHPLNPLASCTTCRRQRRDLLRTHHCGHQLRGHAAAIAAEVERGTRRRRPDPVDTPPPNSMNQSRLTLPGTSLYLQGSYDQPLNPSFVNPIVSEIVGRLHDHWRPSA